MANKLGKNIGIFLRKAGRNANANSAELLIATGIAASITSLFLVADASPKAKEALERKRANDPEDLPKSKRIATDVLTVAPFYAPALIVEFIAIGCTLKSYKISTKRLAAMTTAYTLSENRFKEYQQKVIEKFGEKKEQQVQHEVTAERMQKNPPTPENTLNNITGDGMFLCYHEYTGRYFYSNKEEILRAVNEVNSRFINVGVDASLNDFWYEVGAKATPSGEDIGWKNGYTLEVSPFDWQNIDGHDSPVLVLRFTCEPRPNYITGFH